jgi:hypothetical protein
MMNTANSEQNPPANDESDCPQAKYNKRFVLLLCL